MTEVTDVGINNGTPESGTGTVPTLSKTNTVIGAVNETAPANDTASSGLNGRLQRIAQNITAFATSLLAKFPAALGAGGGIKVDGSGTALPVSGTVSVNALPTGANTIGVVGVAGTVPVSGTVAVASLPATPAGANAIGTVGVTALPALPAGTNNIGDVDIATMPALPAGTNNIGDVDVLTVPADPFGANADAASATGSISAKLRSIATSLAGTIAVSIAGTLTVATHAVTQSGNWVIAAGTALIGKVGIDQTTPGTTDRVSVGKTTYIDVTLSLDTAIYAIGDVLADTQVITAMSRVADFGGILQSITVIDKDDQKAPMLIFFLDQNVALGTENAAPSITDANAAAIMGPPISIQAGDYYDLGGVSVAGVDGIGKVLKPAAGTANGYLAVLNGAGTPTFTAAGVVLRLGILQD
jgi:hypothetical protein